MNTFFPINSTSSLDREVSTSRRMGGDLSCKDHHPDSPRVWVPERNTDGQLTDNIPATVHFHCVVLFLKGNKIDQLS